MGVELLIVKKAKENVQIHDLIPLGKSRSILLEFLNTVSPLPFG